jgi:hypothetical protein
MRQESCRRDMQQPSASPHALLRSIVPGVLRCMYRLGMFSYLLVNSQVRASATTQGTSCWQHTASWMIQNWELQCMRCSTPDTDVIFEHSVIYNVSCTCT